MCSSTSTAATPPTSCKEPRCASYHPTSGHFYKSRSWTTSRWITVGPAIQAPSSTYRPSSQASTRCLLVTEPETITPSRSSERLRRYRRSHSLELGDALIGASAVQYGERLATFNRRQHPGISRLIPWH